MKAAKFPRIHIPRDKPMIWQICDVLSESWQTKPMGYHCLRYSVCWDPRKRERRFDRALFMGLRRGYILRQGDGFMLGKHSQADRARERRCAEKEAAEKARAERATRLAANPPAAGQWSNLFDVSLTAENLKLAISKMKADVAANEGASLAVQPNVIMLPMGMAERMEADMLRAARWELARAERRARQGVLSGHYQKRQRQRAHSVAELRAAKKRGAKRMLPFYRNELRRIETHGAFGGGPSFDVDPSTNEVTRFRNVSLSAEAAALVDSAKE